MEGAIRRAKSEQKGVGADKEEATDRKSAFGEEEGVMDDSNSQNVSTLSIKHIIRQLRGFTSSLSTKHHN